MFLECVCLAPTDLDGEGIRYVTSILWIGVSMGKVLASSAIRSAWVMLTMFRSTKKQTRMGPLVVSI